MYHLETGPEDCAPSKISYDGEIRFVRSTFIVMALISTFLAYSNCSHTTSPSATPHLATYAALATSEIYLKSKLVWFGAHPDDEQYLSFLLKDFCVRPDKSCTIISMTKGESGKCQLVAGCLPALVTVRTHEFVNSAAYLGTSEAQYTLADGSAVNNSSVMFIAHFLICLVMYAILFWTLAKVKRKRNGQPVFERSRKKSLRKQVDILSLCFVAKRNLGGKESRAASLAY